MNLGAGQPASLPYGVEPQRWYSYHSMQFSSPLQQSDLPFSSVCYHPPPPGNYPPPLHPTQPNHYLPPHHFTPPNPYPPLLHFAEPNSYPPPPTPTPYSAYAYHPHQPSYPHTQPHFIPTNQVVPPHITHEPPPPIADLMHAEPDPPLPRLDEFMESMSRLLDDCISKCFKGMRVSEDSSPSLRDNVPVPTQMPKSQSSEPRKCSPLRQQPNTKQSPRLGDAQSLLSSTSRIKQAFGEAIPTTGGVKKRRHWKRNKLLMCNKSLLQGLVVSSRRGNIVSVQINNTHSGSGTGSIVPNLTGSSVPNPNFVNNGCDSTDYVPGAKLSGVDMMIFDNGKRSCDMTVMDSGDGFCRSRVAALTSIRDKGGGLCKAVKAVMVDRIENVVVSDCEVNSPGCLKTDNYGCTANMERAPALRDNNMAGYMFSKTTMEMSADCVLDNVNGSSVKEVSDPNGISDQSSYEHSSVAQGFIAVHHPVRATSQFRKHPLKQHLSIGCEGIAASVQYGIPSIHALPLNEVTSCKSHLSTMELPACTMENCSFLSKIVINGSLCKRLEKYIEGLRKISHYALQPCFSGFDKRIRDKGSGQPTLTYGNFVLEKELTGNMRLLWCVGYILCTLEAPNTMQNLGSKFNHQKVLQLLSSDMSVSVVEETSTSLDLLQHEYHTYLVDGTAIAIFHLHLNEAAEVYKKLKLKTGSAYEFDNMWKRGIDSRFFNFADQMCLIYSPHKQHTMKFLVGYVALAYCALVKSDQSCLQAENVILVVASYVYRRMYKDGRMVHVDGFLKSDSKLADLLEFEEYKMQELMRPCVTIHNDHEDRYVSTPNSPKSHGDYSDLVWSFNVAKSEVRWNAVHSCYFQNKVHMGVSNAVGAEISDVGNGFPLVLAPDILDNKRDGVILVNNQDGRTAVLVHDDEPWLSDCVSNVAAGKTISVVFKKWKEELYIPLILSLGVNCGVARGEWNTINLEIIEAAEIYTDIKVMTRHKQDVDLVVHALNNFETSKCDSGLKLDRGTCAIIIEVSITGHDFQSAFDVVLCDMGSSLIKSAMESTLLKAMLKACDNLNQENKSGKMRSVFDVMTKSKSKNAGNLIVKLLGHVVEPEIFSEDNINYLKIVPSMGVGFTVSGTWHVTNGVKEDLKIEIVAAMCKDVEDLSLTTFAPESIYFYGKTTTLLIISEYRLVCKWRLELKLSRRVHFRMQQLHHYHKTPGEVTCMIDLEKCHVLQDDGMMVLDFSCLDVQLECLCFLIFET